MKKAKDNRADGQRKQEHPPLQQQPSSGRLLLERESLQQQQRVSERDGSDSCKRHLLVRVSVSLSLSLSHTLLTCHLLLTRESPK